MVNSQKVASAEGNPIASYTSSSPPCNSAPCVFSYLYRCPRPFVLDIRLREGTYIRARSISHMWTALWTYGAQMLFLPFDNQVSRGPPNDRMGARQKPWQNNCTDIAAPASQNLARSFLFFSFSSFFPSFSAKVEIRKALWGIVRAVPTERPNKERGREMGTLVIQPSLPLWRARKSDNILKNVDLRTTTPCSAFFTCCI